MDQDAEVTDGTLRIEVEKAKISWGIFLQNMMRSRGSASSQFGNYSGRGPSVVARNAHGDTRVIEVAKTLKQARDRASAIEEEFHTLDVAQWCERYDVPVSFVSG
jgi:hypothetical protein